MIDISDLEFSYGDEDFRLRIPALAVSSAETVSIVGPSTLVGIGRKTLSASTA